MRDFVLSYQESIRLCVKSALPEIWDKKNPQGKKPGGFWVGVFPLFHCK